MSYKYLTPIEDGGEKILKRKIPIGFAWLAWITPGKTAYKLLRSFSKILDDVWVEFYRTVCDELSPYRTEQLLPEWEKALSLPDKCIGAGLTIEERREMVLFRLRRKRWTTIADWQEIAEMLGVEATFTPGDTLDNDLGYNYDYPIFYGGFRVGGRYRVYIELHNCGTEGYDYNYPLVYPTESAACRRLRCILERIRPACVILIWDKPPSIPDPVYDTWDAEGYTMDSDESFA